MYVKIVHLKIKKNLKLADFAAISENIVPIVFTEYAKTAQDIKVINIT